MLRVNHLSGFGRRPSGGGLSDLPSSGLVLDINPHLFALSNGASVVSLTDYSGNGRDGSQATSGKRGTYVTGAQNGKAAVDFTAANSVHYNFTLPSLSAMEIFAVLKIKTQPPAGLSSSGLWSNNGGSATNFPYYNDGLIYEGLGTNSTRTVWDPTPFFSNLATQYHVYNVRSQSNDFKVLLDGVLGYSSTSNTVSVPTSWVLGGESSPTPTARLDGYLLRLAIYDHVLNSTDRDSILSTFASSYGLTVPYVAPTFPSGLPLWGRYEADNESVADGATATSWSDMSGNGHTLTQGGATTITKRKLFGMDVFDFSSNGYLVVPSMSGLTQAEIFFVLKAVADPNSAPRLLGFGSGDADSYYNWTGDNNIYAGSFSNARKNSISKGITLTNYHCLNIESQTNLWKLRTNGVQRHSTATNTFEAPTNGRIGANNNSANIGYGGRIAAIYIFDTVLNSTQRTDVHTYLNAKYAMSL